MNGAMCIKPSHLHTCLCMYFLVYKRITPIYLPTCMYCTVCDKGMYLLNLTSMYFFLTSMYLPVPGQGSPPKSSEVTGKLHSGRFEHLRKTC